MQVDQITQFLTALKAKKITRHGKWVTCSCPLAKWTHTSGQDNHPSFAIKVTAGKSVFNCFSCHHGDLMDLILLMRNYGATSPEYDLKNAVALANMDGDDEKIVLDIKEFDGVGAEIEEEVYYPESWLGSFQKASFNQQAIKYLLSRDVHLSTCEDFDIRYDSKLNAVAFPIRNFTGDLVGLRARRIAPTEDEPRYHIYKVFGKHNPLPWFNEDRVDFDKPIVMVESVFDLMSVWRVYKNVIAPLSVGMSKEKVNRMAQAVEIVTLFDSGKGGGKARQAIQKYLGAGRLVSHIELETGDPGDLSEDQVRAYLSAHGIKTL